MFYGNVTTLFNLEIVMAANMSGICARWSFSYLESYKLNLKEKKTPTPTLQTGLAASLFVQRMELFCLVS